MITVRGAGAGACAAPPVVDVAQLLGCILLPLGRAARSVKTTVAVARPTAAV